MNNEGVGIPLYRYKIKALSIPQTSNVCGSPTQAIQLMDLQPSLTPNCLFAIALILCPCSSSCPLYSRQCLQLRGMLERREDYDMFKVLCEQEDIYRCLPCRNLRHHSLAIAKVTIRVLQNKYLTQRQNRVTTYLTYKSRKQSEHHKHKHNKLDATWVKLDQVELL